MRRREFIALLSSTGWALAARAQSGDRVRRVGALFGGSASDPDLQSNARALEKSLQKFGVDRRPQSDHRLSLGRGADFSIHD
jgi:hypothetical protein